MSAANGKPVGTTIGSFLLDVCVTLKHIQQEAANSRADRFAVCCTHRAKQSLAFYTVLNCGDGRDSAHACFETAAHRHDPSPDARSRLTRVTYAQLG